MEFSRIQLTNWRNFVGCDIKLQNRTFLIGANASGKSNFLDSIRFLRDLVVAGGGLQRAVSTRGGVSAIRSINARNITYIAIDVELSDNNETIWRYQLEFNQDSAGVLLHQERVWQRGQIVLDRPDQQDEQDKERLRQTYLEQTFANKDFRDVVDFFRSITYFHVVPQLVRDPERSVGKQADPFGEDFLEQIAGVQKRSRQVRLRRITDALKLAIPQLEELDWERDDKGIPHLKGRYQNWRPRGVWQRETEFSDGTLRLIGLLWSLQDGQGPLLLEEPELSLHPGVVRHLPQLIRNVQRKQKKAFRQLLVSTHSRDLLTDEGIAADEIVLFQPMGEQTQISLGVDDAEIMHEIASGFTIADIAIPRTEPPDLKQLSLWE